MTNWTLGLRKRLDKPDVVIRGTDAMFAELLDLKILPDAFSIEDMLARGHDCVLGLE